MSARSEVELHTSVVAIDARSSGGRVITGLSPLGIDVQHEFGVQRGYVPAIAVAGEYLAPVGSLAPRIGAWSGRLIVTEATPLFRVHANLGMGTWSVRPQIVTACPDKLYVGQVTECGAGIRRLPPDAPCLRAPTAGSSALCGIPNPYTPVEPSVTTDTSAAVGRRWLGGVGIDRVFPLSSTVLMADVVAEQFVNLYERTDVSADIGLRHQLTPTVVFDFGVSRHFRGEARENAITIGLTYATPYQFGRRGGE